MRSLKLMAAAALLTLSFCGTAYANWNQDGNGWWYENSNGSYTTNAWQQIGSKWYYFDGSGYMISNRWIGDYYLGADGAMLTSTTTPDGYRVGADGTWIQESNEHDDIVNVMNRYDVSMFQFEFTEPLRIVDKGDYYEVNGQLADEITVPDYEIEGKRIGDSITANDGKIYTITRVSNNGGNDTYYYVDSYYRIHFYPNPNTGEYILVGDSFIPERQTVYSGKVRILKGASITLNVDYEPNNYKTISAQDFFGGLSDNPFAGVTEVFATFNEEGYITTIKQNWQS